MPTLKQILGIDSDDEDDDGHAGEQRSASKSTSTPGKDRSVFDRWARENTIVTCSFKDDKVERGKAAKRKYSIAYSSDSESDTGERASSSSVQRVHDESDASTVVRSGGDEDGIFGVLARLKSSNSPDLEAPEDDTGGEGDEWIDSANDTSDALLAGIDMRKVKTTPRSRTSVPTPSVTVRANTGYTTTKTLQRKISTPLPDPPSSSSSLDVLYPTFCFEPSRSLDAVTLLGSESIVSEHDTTKAKAIKTSEIPAAAARYLFSYQIEGTMWLWQKYIEGQGAILADEMGLGKTIQIIALLLAAYEKTGTNVDKERNRRKRTEIANSVYTETTKVESPSLIVAPASVVDNWEEEIRKWGHFSLLKAIRKSDDVISDIGPNGVEVVLMSYDYMKCTIDQLERIDWKFVVFDEGHKLMNAESHSHIAALRFRKAQCRIILTGIPPL